MFMEIGHFLNQRLTALGIQHVFGVPGDFNLSYLEQIEEHDALEFVGNCNELNAAYAADGYARVHGFSALVTTALKSPLSSNLGSKTEPVSRSSLIRASLAEQRPGCNVIADAIKRVMEGH